jgi:hypothetical protein
MEAENKAQKNAEIAKTELEINALNEKLRVLKLITPEEKAEIQKQVDRMLKDI